MRLPRGSLHIAFSYGCLLLSSGTILADTIKLTVAPANESVSEASPVTVDIAISGLGGGTALGVYDINLAFEATILSLDTTMFGDPVLGDQLDPLGLGNTIASSTPGVGTVELFELSLDSIPILDNLQASSFTLATLTFNALADGISPLDLSINSLGDASGNPLSASVQNGSVTIGSIPEPSSLLFLGTIVIGFIARLGFLSLLSAAAFCTDTSRKRHGFGSIKASVLCRSSNSYD